MVALDFLCLGWPKTEIHGQVRAVKTQHATGLYLVAAGCSDYRWALKLQPGLRGINLDGTNYCDLSAFRPLMCESMEAECKISREDHGIWHLQCLINQ